MIYSFCTALICGCVLLFIVFCVCSFSKFSVGENSKEKCEINSLDLKHELEFKKTWLWPSNNKRFVSPLPLPHNPPPPEVSPAVLKITSA